MTRRSKIAMIAIVVLIIFTGSSGERCNQAERQALLDFKAGLSRNHEASDRVQALSSWGQESAKRECCEWLGVKCDTKSGHVVTLDLSPATFNLTDRPFTLLGELSSSLVDLPHLTYLDLSCIGYDMTHSLPGFIGSLGKLKYLNLSNTGLIGEVPPQLGNLSALQILDLSGYTALKTISNFGWVSNLLSLQSLNLTKNDISKAKDWLDVVSHLPNLSELRLQGSQLLYTVPRTNLCVNASRNLIYLDLSENPGLSSSIYPWISNHSDTLVHVDLKSCYLGGSFPELFRNMDVLEYLDLRYNFLEGSIPEYLENLKAISYLFLSFNKLEGLIPENFGNISALEYLDLNNNHLHGEIPKSIWRLCSLRVFDASANNLTGQLRFSKSTFDCTHFPLEYLHLSHNGIGGPLPNLTLYPSLIILDLHSNRLDGKVPGSELSNLIALDLSSNAIEGVLTEAHFLNLSKLTYLDLSSNSDLALNFSADWIPSFQLESIKLRSCKLGPHFPMWLRNQKSYYEIDISDSGISHSIPNWFWNLPKTALTLNLSNNHISGTIQGSDMGSTYMISSVDLSSNRLEGSIPVFLLNVNTLFINSNNFSDINSLCTTLLPLLALDISFNQLSGELPDCWSNAENLIVLVLTQNNLSGRIPSSFGFLTHIWALHLSYNRLAGGLPVSLKNCLELRVLDVGENNLSGQLPSWIGTDISVISILSLRKNKFNGSIPWELCRLGNLQVLDLSSNDLTSSVPRCVGYLETMKREENVFHTADNEKMFLLWKGTVSRFVNFDLIKSIDLSSNKLDGEIPNEVTNLTHLVSLNLSRNFLIGKIPQQIGKLTSLDVLDLSNNDLSGPIPSSLAKIDRLNTLDLSNNNLSGKIPTGPQLQMRDFSAYSRNPQLCGEPLSKKCDPKDRVISTQVTEHHARHEEEDKFVTKGFYISTSIGFITAFACVFWSLVLNICKKRRRFRS